MVLPDSPRWLIAHGYKEEGARVIAMLEDRDSPDHPDVVRAQKEIELSLEQESAGGTSSFCVTAFVSLTHLLGPFRYKELLENGPIGNFRRICLCIGINVMQQFTGYVLEVCYY